MSKRRHPTDEEEAEAEGVALASPTSDGLEIETHPSITGDNSVSTALLSPRSSKFYRLDSEDDEDEMPEESKNGGSSSNNNNNNGDNDAGATISASQSSSAMTCTIPGCKMKQFSNSEAYESHYAKEHTNRCHECHRNFPSQRVLECHIKENHDMLSQLKKERGEKIFECFVEGCDKVCSAPAKRRRHLIDKHHYPQEFNFYIVNDGIDRVISLLRSPPRKSRTRIRSPSDASSSGGMMDVDNAPKSPKSHRRTKSNPNSGQQKKRTATKRSNGEFTAKEDDNNDDMEEDHVAEEKDEEMQDLSSKLGGLTMVPHSVRFGRKATGFAKK